MAWYKPIVKLDWKNYTNKSLLVSAFKFMFYQFSFKFWKNNVQMDWLMKKQTSAVDINGCVSSFSLTGSYPWM